jgi:hypothetical protein
VNSPTTGGGAVADPHPDTGRQTRRDWRPGKLRAVRPNLPEFGTPAVLVYDAIEHTRKPVPSFDLATTTGTVPIRRLRSSGNPRRIQPRPTHRRWTIMAGTDLATWKQCPA